MSMSSRTTTPGSILRGSSSSIVRRLQLSKQPKVRFELPHAKKVRKILEEYSRTRDSRRDYENLLVMLRDADLRDDDLLGLLQEATECISLLDRDLRLFVEALLWVQWVNRERAVVEMYQGFIVNLVCAHNYHAKFVIEKLVNLFLADPTAPEWSADGPSEAEQLKYNNVHELINLLLSVIPMCKGLLLQSLGSQFPYFTRSTHQHECYVSNLLWLLNSHPNFRPEILQLIISKLIIMDVHAPKDEIVQAMNAAGEEVFEMDLDSASTKTTTSSSHAVAHTLDVCLDKLFDYIIHECHPDGELNWDKTKSVYNDMITVFDRMILTTYNTHHVQFVMFLLCSLKPSLTEAFLNYLWKKVCNPNVAAVLRQAAANYLASLIARANFVPAAMLKGTLQEMSQWIHAYVSTQDGREYVNWDVRAHSVFYSVCQALFYLVVFRKRDLVRTKKDILFLDTLNMGKMVNCRLNPLRVCQPSTVQKFAALTRKYQLVYCYTVLEHNARTVLPTIYQDERGSTVVSSQVLDACFPFDPYILERSNGKVRLLYLEYKEEKQKKRKREESESVPSSARADATDMEVGEVDDVDDFLLQEAADKFSYGTSPGFKFGVHHL